MLRPLPPFNARPLKRADAPKASPPAMAIAIRADAKEVAANMASNAGRISVKAGGGLETPRLMVLGGGGSKTPTE